MADAVAHEPQADAARSETSIETSASRSTSRLSDDQRDDRGLNATLASEAVNTHSKQIDATIDR
jgi:hypothetical protein